MDHNAQSIVPDEDVLRKFNVRLIAPLGGRMNQHWLVQSKDERFVLRRWSDEVDKPEMEYEVRLLHAIASMGWPVAPVVDGPFDMGGRVWSLFPYLPGDPPSGDDPMTEQRARGRLLAEFHADLAKLSDFGQRGQWRRCEQILSDPLLDQVLADHDQRRPEEIRIIRWHLERARERVSGLQLQDRLGIVIHGDFTTWNLRFQEGKLTGILDFELAHWDHRIGDFALSWRGKYDEVVYGYDEVSPLEPEEWELLTPMWWAGLIENAYRHLSEGTWDDGWIIKKLLERSPLMGRDAVPFR